MKKIINLYSLFVLGLYAAHPASGYHLDSDNDNYIEKVSKRLTELKAYNEANIARGEAEKNVYVLDLSRLDDEIENKFVYDLWETDSDTPHPLFISGQTKKEINEYLLGIEKSLQCYLLLGSYKFLTDLNEKEQDLKKQEALKEIYRKSKIGNSENNGALIDAGFSLLYNTQQIEIFQHYSVVLSNQYSKDSLLHNFGITTSDNVNKDLKENVTSIVHNLLNVKSESFPNIDVIEDILKFSKSATEIASKYTTATACNICVRAALYLIKNDSVLFPSSGSGFHDPNDNFNLKEIKGFISPDGRAHFIKSDFDNIQNNLDIKERFTEITKLEDESLGDFFQRLQNDTDKGEIIIGIMLNSSGTTGHVMMITPGGLYEISDSEVSYGKSFNSRKIEKVPRVLECGGKIRENDAPLCRNVDWRGAKERLKWYKYILN